MDSDSFPAPLSALDQQDIDDMIDKLVVTGTPDTPSSTSPTFMSVLPSPNDGDMPFRHWTVVNKIGKAVFGVTLPDPFEAPDSESVNPAQTTAATKIRNCYLKVSKEVMVRFYSRGLSCVTVAAHLYALDYVVWKHGMFVASPQPTMQLKSCMHAYLRIRPRSHNTSLNYVPTYIYPFAIL